MKKSQISIEFISMMMAATAMILIFVVIFSTLYQDNFDDKKRIISNDFGKSIQNEYIIAAGASSGYSRRFFIPNTLEGFDYNISSNDVQLSIDLDNVPVYFYIPKTTGSIKKGNNKIENRNGTICLNCI
jgi:hypothetical protein